MYSYIMARWGLHVYVVNGRWCKGVKEPSRLGFGDYSLQWITHQRGEMFWYRTVILYFFVFICNRYCECYWSAVKFSSISDSFAKVIVYTCSNALKSIPPHIYVHCSETKPKFISYKQKVLSWPLLTLGFKIWNACIFFYCLKSTFFHQ